MFYANKAQLKLPGKITFADMNDSLALLLVPERPQFFH